LSLTTSVFTQNFVVCINVLLLLRFISCEDEKYLYHDDHILEECYMKVREVIKLIKEDGWYLERTKGDHRQYKHPSKRGLVTISGHLNDEIAKGTLNSILKQAKLKEVRKDV